MSSDTNKLSVQCEQGKGETLKINTTIPFLSHFYFFTSERSLNVVRNFFCLFVRHLWVSKSIDRFNIFILSVDIERAHKSYI